MKIAELVKTYKLLNDPSAPDWNVKFVSGIALATILLAGAGAIVAGQEGATQTTAAVAAAQGSSEPPTEPAGEAPEACAPEDLATDPSSVAGCAPQAELPQLP